MNTPDPHLSLDAPGMGKAFPHEALMERYARDPVVIETAPGAAEDCASDAALPEYDLSDYDVEPWPEYDEGGEPLDPRRHWALVGFCVALSLIVITCYDADRGWHWPRAGGLWLGLGAAAALCGALYVAGRRYGWPQRGEKP